MRVNLYQQCKMHLLLLISCCTLALSAYATDLAITNATIYTLGQQGTLSGATIVIQDGRIAAVGTDVSPPAGVEVVNALGGAVTPGLMNSDTHLGIEEVSAIAQTVDFATTDRRITAALKVADAFNYRSVLIPHNRSQGLTRALVMPESGSSLIAGQAAVVDLSGSVASVLDDYVALVVNLGETGQVLAGGSRAAALMQWREALQDARDYTANRSDFNRGQRRAYALSRLDLDALAAVLNGAKPVIVRVHRAADIRKVMTFAAEQKIKVILSGAEEAWLLAEDIAAAAIPVILDPIKNLPSRYETLNTRADNAALLHRAGVKLLFTGMGWQNTHNAYLVRQSAGNAVANGLPKEVALAAISKNPAEVFSLHNGYGTLTPGEIADLVLWRADPLDVTSEPELVILNGEKASLQTRSSALAQRYYEKIRQATAAP